MSANERPRVVLVNRCFVLRDDGRQLIVKRCAMDRNNPDKWEVPGGKLDSGQDLVHALEREVIEETGLLVEPIHRTAFVDSYTIGDGAYKGLPYIVLFSVTRIVGGELALSEEHSAYKWVTYDELLSFELTQEVKKAAIILKQYLVKTE